MSLKTTLTGTVLTVGLSLSLYVIGAALTQDPPAPPASPPSEDDVDPNPFPPQHKEPTEFCTPSNMPDGKKPCQCLGQHPEGCREGKRETETTVCNSYCWKASCHCCSS